jgi:hypothetical protein
VKKAAWLIPLAVAVRCGVASAQSPAPPNPPPIPAAGAHPRLEIVNQCTSDIWAVFTPGGNPSQVSAQQNSGGWFRSYAQQEQFTGTGATAEAALNTMTMTVAAPPNDTSLYFLPGQFVEIVLATNVQDSTPGPTAMITAVSSSPVVAGTVLTLDRLLTVPPDPANPSTNGKAQIWSTHSSVQCRSQPKRRVQALRRESPQDSDRCRSRCKLMAFLGSPARACAR